MRTRTEIEEMSDGAKTDLILQLQREVQESEARNTRLNELQRIYKLWVRIRGKLYPANCRGESIRGIDLDTLEQTIAGCLSTFLTRERLTQQQKEHLFAGSDDLGWVTLELTGYEGFYFRQLRAIVSAVIEYDRTTSESIA